MNIVRDSLGVLVGLDQSRLFKIMDQQRVDELVLDERRYYLVSLLPQLTDDARNINILEEISD